MTADTETAPARKDNPNAPSRERVISVRHYTDRLFAFRITRPQSFRFRSGEFVMIGLDRENGKPLLRAYSVASPSWDEALEFYSIKVPDGPLTSRLQHIQPGDEIRMARKPTGTLVHDALIPGKHLYLFSTGTGFAPFASIIRDPETYEKFEKVIVTHTCREADELAYGYETVAKAKADPLVGAEARRQLVHFTSLTRDTDCPLPGRITRLISNGELARELAMPRISPETDRVMICGSLDMINDTKALMIAHGLTEGSNAKPGEFVIEKAFAG